MSFDPSNFDLSKEVIQKILEDALNRATVIVAAGGISCKEVVEGKKIPKGWILDHESEFYVPPNLFLDETSRKQ